MGDGGAASRGGLRGAREHLAQPLEAGEGARGQEVVDVRDRRPSCPPPAAGSPGAEASGLSQTRRWQLRRSRAVSAATSAGSPRSQPSDTMITTPELRSVRRAHLWLNSRKLSPIRVPPAQSVTVSATRASARSRSRSFIIRVTRVSRVPNTNDSVRTSLVRASAWANRSRRREWRSIEPADVADDHELARLPDLAPPDPLGELARGQVLAEHRAWREPAAVRVELVAARPPLLQARAEQVHEALRVAQLRRRSSGRSRGGAAARRGTRRRARSSRPRSRRRRPRPRRAGCPAWRARTAWRPFPRPASSAGARLALLAVRVGRRRDVEARLRQRAPAAAPEAVEDCVVDLAVVPAPDEHGGTRRRALVRGGRCRRGRAPARSRSRRRGPPPARRSAAPARSPRPRPAGGGRRRPRRCRRPGSGTRRRPSGQAAGAGLGEVLAGRGAPDLADVLLVLEDDAQRLVDHVRLELGGAQRQERRRPVQRLRDARHLGEVRGPQPVHEGDDLAARAVRARPAPGSRRSRTPWPPSGSRSSGRGSGASGRRGPRGSGSRSGRRAGPSRRGSCRSPGR